MAFSSKEDGYSAEALQSDLDESSVDLNHFDERYTNVSEEEVYFPNAIDEEYMTNDWNVNQNSDPEEYPACASSSSKGIICNSQLSTNELHTAIPSSADPSYSSGFVQALCKSVRQANAAFLANAVMQSNAQQPPFSAIKDGSACASDNEQETEQARHEQLLMDEDVPLHHHPLRPHEIELIDTEEIQGIAGSALNSQDDNVNRHDAFQYDPPDDEEASMFDDDHDGKDFSSWLLYGSDDGIAAFKNNLSEYTSGDKPQTTVSTHTEKISTAKPTTRLQDGSHDRSFKEHTVSGSGSQASRAPLDEKSKSDTTNDPAKEAEDRSNAKPLSNLDPKQCNSSHEPPGRQSPLLDTHSPPEADSSFKDAIVCTSTPKNTTRHAIILDNQAASREVSPIKEIKQSKYFLRENRNA